MRASRKWLALAESASVLALILLYIWRLRLERPEAWAGIFGLVLLSHALRGETPGALGFRADGFRAAARDWLLPLLAGVAGAFALGAVLGTIRYVRVERTVSNLV